MDGYSVKDAAVVLGIPERRVWELLARGVLAGAPEGPDGMIVFLQPRSPSASVAQPSGSGDAADSAGPRINGNGGSHEPSPFRELLTEFRNLTERYGQALLALGEARGEVAALRGRVDLLEARMDLRLPGAPPASTVAWEIPDAIREEDSAPAAVEADASDAEPPAAAELDETVAGEDEPAAEPMIDLVDEAAFAVADVEDEAQVSEEMTVAAEDAEAVAPEPVAPEPPEPAPVEAAQVEFEAAEPNLADAAEGLSEPMEAAILADAVDEAEELAEPPRRRARGGHTATAAFAAALARADDPTLAELPGAEETAAALAALQRDIEATQADAEPAGEPEAEPELEAAPEPEAVAAPEQEPEPLEPEVAAAAIDEVVADETAEAEFEAEPVPATEVEATPEAAPEEPQASVPSYYSTDVVEPDWFADGDFSWLEAAQAEATRAEAEQPEVEDVPGEPTVDERPEADEPSGAPPGEGGDEELSPVAFDVGEGSGVAAELAFGDHPPAEATQPDLGHEGGFEPSAESQAIAEEEARAAIQDAFSEAAGADEEESPAMAGPAVAVATAVAEPEAVPELAEEPVIEETVAEEPAVEEPVIEETVAEEPAVDEPVAEEMPAEQSAEVEAEAIQEAFDEPTQPPEWSAPAVAAYEPPAAEAPATEPDEALRAYDETPASIAAAEGATVWRGPEEFIAPPMPAAAPAIATPQPPQPQSTAASGEEELMWLGDEFEEADLEVAAQGWRSPDAAPAAQAAPALELSDAELAQLAEDEGWDADEVEAIRRLLGRPTDAPSPPSAASSTAVPEARPIESPQPPPAPPPDVQARAAGDPLAPGPGDPPDPEWLEGRGGPAADAYRRLRKLFPS